MRLMQFVILKTMKSTRLTPSHESHAASRVKGLGRICGFLLAIALLETQGHAAISGTPEFCAKAPSRLHPQDSTPALVEFQSFSLQGGYVAGGVGMRNRGFGHISVAGIPACSTIYAAYLYWDILGGATPDDTFSEGEINGQQITGQLVATGEDPCWGNSANFSYRADVTSLVSGNGTYSLTDFASGTTDGSDPWMDGTSPPMMEGASLVILYENSSSPPTTILIYEGAALTGGDLLELTIDGFTAPNSPFIATTTFIGADGQEVGEPATCTFNGHILPTVAWDGDDPQDGPAFTYGNLWDTMTTNVTSLISADDTSATVTVQKPGDCVVWIAQVFSIGGDPLQITPAAGFDATGCVGGPFSITNETFSLTNTGTNSLNWSLADMSLWLDASPAGGTLAAGGSTNITVSLNSNACSLTPGSYTASVWFTDLNDGFMQSLKFSLGVGSPVPVDPIGAPITGPVWWMDTGISLTDGATVVITASGCWNMNADDPYSSCCGPDGWPSTTNSPQNFFSGANLDALIAYVGSDPFQGQSHGTGFFPQSSGYWNIGVSNQFTSSNFGELWLGVNDTIALDLPGPSTTGSMTAQITGTCLIGSIVSRPPTLSIATPTPGLHFVEGSISSQYDWQNIVTANSAHSWNYSWAGATSANPVAYSFNISQFTAPDLNYHIYFYNTCCAACASAPDYNQPDVLVLQVSPAGNNTAATAALLWKTNTPTANATNMAIQITSASLTGAWTLQFTSPAGGILTAADTTAHPFTINPGLAANLAEAPITVNFGINPSSDSPSIVGEEVVISQISITGVDPLSINYPTTDNFLADSSLDPNTWTVNAVTPGSIWLVATNDVCSVDWTLPDYGFSLSVAANLENLGSGTSLGLPTVLLTPGVRTLIPRSSLPAGNSAFFYLVQRIFTQLLVALPGQTFTPGTGVTGTPLTIYNGPPWPETALVYAVDANYNLMTGVTDTIAITSPGDTVTSDDFAPPINVAMVGGVAAFNGIYGFSWGNDGLTAPANETVTAQDASDPSIPTATSAPVDLEQ